MSNANDLPSQTGEWLDLLPQHPIFSSPKSSNQSDTDMSSSSTQQDHRGQHLLAIHDNHLFVCVYSQHLPPSTSPSSTFKKGSESSSVFQQRFSSPQHPSSESHRSSSSTTFPSFDLTIRVLNLTEFKSSCLKLKRSRFREEMGSDVENESFLDHPELDDASVDPMEHPLQMPFMFIQTKTVDFLPTRLTINGNGKLLAISGSGSVDIIALPKGPKSRAKNNSIVHRQFSLPTHDCRVVKTLWHPLSSEWCHLLVLTADGVLRLYDVASNPTEPEQTFLFGPNRKFGKVRFTADESEYIATSFTLGSGDMWKSFTVYVIMESGDVYSMCPILPSSCLLSSQLLKELKTLSYLNLQECEDEQLMTEEDTYSPAPQLYDFYSSQLHFISNLLKNAKHVEGTDQLIVSNNLEKNHKVLCRGPYLIRPSPPDLPIDTTSTLDIIPRATDLLYVDMETVGIIVMAYSDGRVDICLELDTPEAMWGETGLSREHLPALHVYESVDLGLHKVDTKRLDTNEITLILDPLYNDTFYCYHNMGAHAIVIKKWVNRLISLWKKSTHPDNQEQDFEKIVTTSIEDRKDSSTVRWIVKTIPSNKSDTLPMIGLQVISDPFLTYSLFILAQNHQLITFELSLRVMMDQELTAAEQANRLKASEVDTIVLGHKPILAEDLIGDSFIAPRVVIPDNPSQEQVISILSDTMEKLFYQLSVLNATATKMKERTSQQELEYRLQKRKLTELEAMISTLKDSRMNFLNNLESYRQRQETLTIRMESALQMAICKHTPELSKYEKLYIEELQKTNRLVKDSFIPKANKMRQKWRGLRDTFKEHRLEYLEEELLSREMPLNEDQVKHFEFVLPQLNDIIQETQDKLQSLESAIEKLTL